MKRNLLIVCAVCLCAMVAIMAFAPAETSQSKRFAIVENKAEKRVDITVDGKPFTTYI